MTTVYFYILMCAIWFAHNVRTRNTPFNTLERFLTWTLFIPVTFLILAAGLVLIVIELCKERS